MEYEIRVVDGKPRQLAGMRGATSRAELPRTILKLLDTVWPVLRAQQVLTGHNVVVYFGGLAHIEAGVEVFGDFVDVGDVHHSQTPAGPAVTTAHWGDYSQKGGAYGALERWGVGDGPRQSGARRGGDGGWAGDPRPARNRIFLLLT